MNKSRRKRIDKILSDLDNALALSADHLAEVRDEEQEAFDKLSENSQEGDRGQAMEDAIYAIEELIDEIEEMRSRVQDGVIE